MTISAPRQPARRPRRPRQSDAAGRGPAGPAGRGPGSRRPPTRVADEDHAPLQRLAAGFSQAFLEVEAGRRTRAQLEPVLCPQLALRLADRWVQSGPPGRLVHTHGVLVAPNRYEAVAVVRRGDRFGALVVTIIRVGAVWRVVDAARPEDGTPARPTPPDP
ncbi:MAG TPA: Rv3235 family protein [Egibacteraceae bacterium]|nr:Rv3235 family protein [Egibacteraceae bacterium]